MRIISVCNVITLARGLGKFWLLFILVFFSAILPGRVDANWQNQLPDASEGQINEALQVTVPVRFLPGHGLYPLIWIKEEAARFFKPSAAKKAQFDLVLAGKKLKEAYLLAERQDRKNTAVSLAYYSSRLENMTKQFEKARSQKQDVVALADEIAENLRVHETLFVGINNKVRLFPGENEALNISVDGAFEGAIDTHRKAVLMIDNVKPGVKSRFSTYEENDSIETEPLLIPEVSESYEATPNSKPRRIIF